MTRPVAIVTDGSPESAALARWLADRGAPIVIVDALGPGDASVIAEARRRAGDRVIVVHDDRASDVPAEDALAATRAWLGELGPFERRVRGAPIIEERLTARAPGFTEIERLLRRLAPSTRITKPEKTPNARRARPPGPTKRPGRPPGSDPFRGAGLDVCVTMLLDPSRTWSERALATASARSPHAVHRAVIELSQRGYLERPRGAIRAARPLALRDDLAAAWSARRAQRGSRGWIAPHRAHVEEDVAAALIERGIEAFLAGPSALRDGLALVGGALVIYAGADADGALEAASFRPTRGAPDLVVFEIDEPAIRLAPRALRPIPATNRVVTFLDLVASGIDRHAEAARALWEDAA